MFAPEYFADCPRVNFRRGRDLRLCRLDSRFTLHGVALGTDDGHVVLDLLMLIFLLLVFRLRLRFLRAALIETIVPKHPVVWVVL